MMCFSDVIKCKTEERNLLKQAAAVTLVGVLLEGIGIKKKPKALAVFGVTHNWKCVFVGLCFCGAK